MLKSVENFGPPGPPAVTDYRRGFIAFAIDCGVLRFGRFVTKSGRTTPYFFDAGLFHTGARLAQLAEFYAHAIRASNVGFDMVFGPAYKGIVLAAAITMAFARQGRDVPYAYNRKEAKDHGEGGTVVGAPLTGRVLIVDDVITAGTAVGESVSIIRAAGATPAGVAVCLDRMERGTTALSAVQEVEQHHGMAVAPIATLDDLVEYLEGAPQYHEGLRAIAAYRQQYGAPSHV